MCNYNPSIINLLLSNVVDNLVLRLDGTEIIIHNGRVIVSC